MPFACVILLSVLALSRANLICANPDQFQSSNLDLKRSGFQDSQTGEMRLHQFLFSNKNSISKSSSSEVKKAQGLQGELTIMFRRFDNKEIRIQRELNLFKEICGFPKVLPFSLSTCNSNLIPGFRGCVRDENGVYFYQNSMDRSLDDPKIQKIYRGKSPIERIKIKLGILDKFYQLHKLKIIHGDIKPSNLMINGEDFSDVRIHDLGIAHRLNNKDFKKPPNYEKQVHRDEDIYTYASEVRSLAMTFAYMQDDSLNDCLNKGKCDFTDIHEFYIKLKLNDIAYSSFNRENKLYFLKPIIEKATTVSSRSVYQSVQEFLIAMVDQTAKHIIASDGQKDYESFLKVETDSDDLISWTLKLKGRELKMERKKRFILGLSEDFSAKDVDSILPIISNLGPALNVLNPNPTFGARILI